MTISPIAVGGVGGSGTRVVAAILQQAGIFIGNDLNDALDNRWFPLLFTHRGIHTLVEAEFNQRVSLFVAAMTGNRRLTEDDYSIVNQLTARDGFQNNTARPDERAKSLLASVESAVNNRAWGWKAPNTHVVIERMARVINGLKYIHVARNGLDMAFSQNQNQLRIWGPRILGDDCAVTPRNSLRFWCWAHERILQIATGMEPDFLFLKFEDVCSDPETQVRRILTFAGVEADTQLVNRATALVVPPKSIGRHKGQPLDIFDPGDVAFVKRLGFKVGE